MELRKNGEPITEQEVDELLKTKEEVAHFHISIFREKTDHSEFGTRVELHGASNQLIDGLSQVIRRESDMSYILREAVKRADKKEPGLEDLLKLLVQAMGKNKQKSSDDE